MPYRQPRQLDALTAFALAQLPAAGLLPKSAWGTPQSPSSPSETALPELAAAVWEAGKLPYVAVVVCASDDGCLDDVEVNKVLPYFVMTFCHSLSLVVVACRGSSVLSIPVVT